MDRLLKDAMKTRMTQPVNCPDAEQIAAWADGTIYGAAAEGLESHLADCERCQAVLAAFVATEPVPALASVSPIGTPAPVDTPQVRTSPRPARMPYVWLGAAAASLLLWLAWPKPPQVAPPDVSIARSEASAPAQGSLTLEKSSATPTPAQTPVIGPAPRQASEAAKPAETLAKANAPVQAAEKSARPAAGTVVVAAPPPPPPATVPPDLIQTPRAKPTADAVMTQTASRADNSNTLSFLIPLPGGGVEFGPTDAVADVTLTPTRQGVAASRANPLKAIRWRVMLSGLVEKTIDSGATWKRIVLDPAIVITTGASPSDVVCWLVGKAGTVLRSTDGGATFVKVTAPVSTDLVSINATDARTATVVTSDGRRLTTTDGGQNWQRE